MNVHTNLGTKVFKNEQFKEAFNVYKVYLYMLSYSGFMCPLYAVSQFLLTFIEGMQFGKLVSILLTGSPYTIGAFTTIVLAYHSDRKMEKCLHFCFSIAISAIGFLIVAAVANNHTKYFGAFLAVMDVAISIHVHLSWLNNSILGSTKTGTVSAMIVSFGNVWGIVAGQVYRISEAFTPSYLINMAFILMLLVVAIGLRYGLSSEKC